MKRNLQPQFLRIRWEDTTEQGAAVTLETMACLRHRREIALAYPVPEEPGGGAMSATCARSSPTARRSQLGSPDGSPARPAALGAPR